MINLYNIKKDLWTKLKETDKPILLFGMGDGANKVLDVLAKKNIDISGVFCSDDFYREKYFNGYKVLTYAMAKQIYKEMIVLMCFGSQRQDVFEIIDTIKSENEFYVPDVPVFGQGLFDLEYFNLHKNEFETVYNMLYDEQSKKVYQDVLCYKITGDIKYLINCQTQNDEAFKNIIKPKDEVFLDLGAYNGDTVLEFCEFCKEYQKILAVEPDVKNFNKLKKNTSHICNIEYFNNAIDIENNEIIFCNKGGRNSVIGKNDGVIINAITIDHVGKDATYIKMDLEGNEKNAILGGKQVIKAQKPKMLVSAYHRNEDLFELPLLIKEINPDYKVFVRHYPYFPAWDTNLYFI